MATITCSRSDLFPPTTTVGVYPAESRADSAAPRAAQITSGTVDAAGNLSITNAGILSYTSYVLYALVSSEHRYVRARSTLDISDLGRGIGTCTLSNGSATVSSVVVTSGALAVGQRFTAPGVPPGRYIISGSAGTWTLNDGQGVVAGVGVAFAADGASPAVANLGATAVPVSVSTWRAKVRQRRQIMGTAI